MSLTPALEDTLIALAGAADEAADPWWIIGSAAVALLGGPVTDVRDVDLAMTARDAASFLERVGAGPERRGPNRLFRSYVFGTWSGLPLPIEVMGGFRYASRGTWRPFGPRTRLPVTVGGETVFVPSAAELKALLLEFGRDKDIARAVLLDP